MAYAVMSWVTEQFGTVMAAAVDLWWIFALLIAGAYSAWYIRQKKRFPLKTVLIERRGDDIVTNLKDTLGRIKEDGLWKWKFRKSKDTLPPESYEYLTKCTNAIGCAYLIKYGPGQYKPVDVKPLFKDGTFRIIDQDDWNFKVLENRATMERRKALKDMWEKFGPMIGLALVVVLFIISMYFAYEFIDKQINKSPCLSGAMAAQAKAAAEAAAAKPVIPGISNLLNPAS